LIAGQDFDRIDKIRLHRYINSCAIENGSYEEKFFLYYQGITELTVKHKKIIQEKNIYIDHDDVKKEWIANNNFLELLKDKYKTNKIFFFKPEVGGSDLIIGGNYDNDYKVPKIEKSISKFLYLGKISCQNEFLNWIDLDWLYIFYPIYESVEGPLFFDYSNPKKPKIINDDVFFGAWADYVPKNIDDFIVEKKEYKITREGEYLGDNFYKRNVVMGGIPKWYQSPDIPVCPINNKDMKFICSFDSNSCTNKILDKTTGKEVSESFLGDVYEQLLIFFEPESKTLCITNEIS